MSSDFSAACSPLNFSNRPTLLKSISVNAEVDDHRKEFLKQVSVAVCSTAVHILISIDLS